MKEFRMRVSMRERVVAAIFGLAQVWFSTFAIGGFWLERESANTWFFFVELACGAVISSNAFLGIFEDWSRSEVEVLRPARFSSESRFFFGATIGALVSSALVFVAYYFLWDFGRPPRDARSLREVVIGILICGSALGGALMGALVGGVLPGLRRDRVPRALLVLGLWLGFFGVFALLPEDRAFGEKMLLSCDVALAILSVIFLRRGPPFGLRTSSAHHLR